tara:strand:+ start:10291 stop:11490 length:1200 start_codon:yes stop_codon:yes gene_type:complete
MIIGITGKPNCGKSTFFKAATLAEIEIGNYPFVTIKPNSGVGYVKIECVDKEFDVQCNPRQGHCANGTRFVPVELIDVAGLVPGAHEGVGLGNQFLDDLRQADALIHVIDCSGGTNEKGETVDVGSYDPANDVKFLETEIDMWYLGIMKKSWVKFVRQVVQEKKQIQKALGTQLSGFKVTEEMVDDGIKELKLDKARPDKWSDEDLLQLAIFFRRKTKPMIIACNKTDISVGYENYKKLVELFPDYIMIPCSAESELALKEAAKHKLIDYVSGENKFEILVGDKLSDKQKNALDFVKKNVLDKMGSTGVQEVLNKSVFELLHYIAIFPGGVNKLADQDGNILPDCFLLPPDSTALDFAYKIHSDIGEGFVKAIDAKTKQAVGKEHKLKHRDVLEIKSSK